MISSLAVYCGSSGGHSPIYRQAAFALGQYLAEQSITLVYGGGSVGLMGAVADGALSKNGTVIGVIPGLLNRKELAHAGITKMHVVETMHERKWLMACLSQGFLALPGGYGTLDELCEVLAWSQLGVHSFPVGVLNVDDYFTPFLQCLDGMAEKGFLQKANRDRLLCGTDFVELISRMATWSPPKQLNWETLFEA